MNDTTHDYSGSLSLPKTDFPIRAGLQNKEPELLAHWAATGLDAKLRELGAGRPRFVLHDGPPYANGSIHIGHAMNKVLKDVVVRSQRMRGKASVYVPGWDCHGLPIEWKVEEEFRARGLAKADVPVVEFRRRCRAFAGEWLGVQREEFKRLGVAGDWDGRYATMDFSAEAAIAAEAMKFAANGLLYRGSKPVMWSVAEGTALAEAEVEHLDHVSDTVFAAFPVKGGEGAVVAWTTTPWTLPGNRALAYSRRLSYGIFRVSAAPEGNWAAVGALYLLADGLAASVMKAAKVSAYERVRDVPVAELASMVCAHPLAGLGYGFDVPLLDGAHVTGETGTGFVHTAPGHGREDFEVWTANARLLAARGVDARVPDTVDADGFYTSEAPGFEGARVLDGNGDKGDANARVVEALAAAGTAVARGRLKHQYPHSWRSKKPVIHRSTPQWFVAMDRPFAVAEDVRPGLREEALREAERTRWVPEASRNRVTGMVANRPDWVVSRQRAWGVPIAVFARKGSNEVLVDERVNARVLEAFKKEGADAWFAEGAAGRFLLPEHDPADYDKVDDVLDVWFDSGSSQAFVLEDAVRFPSLAGLKRKRDGGEDEVMYLEGSDQHRGWFQSSLLVGCGTRGRAPFDTVLTHGFVLDDKGRKMAKSVGNVVSPRRVVDDHGADVLRLWVAGSDCSDDLRVGKETLKTFAETYRKMRNTLRWMLGMASHFDGSQAPASESMPELERFVLHRLSELDAQVREAYAAFDFKRVVALLSSFMAADLSAFYFDVRKDALYCDAPSSWRRRAALFTVDAVCDAVLKWLAPVLCFTAEEAWMEFRPNGGSVHSTAFPAGLERFRDDALAAKWKEVRRVRSVVTGALEVERVQKRIGSPLESAPTVYVSDEAQLAALEGVDLAEVCITSGVELVAGEPPDGSFRLEAVAGVGVAHRRAPGVKCARSWRYFDPATTDDAYPDVTPRDAAALRELGAMATA